MEKLIDLPAERAVLAGIFQHGEEIYLDVIDFLQPTTFTDSTNQTIFRCLRCLFEKKEVTKPDISSLMSVASELSANWIFDKPQEAKYVRSVCTMQVRPENVKIWAAKIRKLEITRLLREQLSQANLELEEIQGNESIEQIVGVAENVIFDFNNLICNTDSNEPELLGSDIDEYLENIEANPVDIVGISSGMPYYDQAIGGGFRRKTVSLIGARSKVGKSMVCANVGMHVSKILGIPVLYLDTEMTKHDHINRLLPNIAHTTGTSVTINDLETGKYISSELKRNHVHEAGKILKQIPFWYKNVSGRSFEEIVSIMRRWVYKHVGTDENNNTNDCLILYDYLKLMTAESISDGLREYQILGFLTTTLHNFAVKYDIPILSVIQLNREGQIAQSDRITWLVTNYSIFKEKTIDELAESGEEHGNRKLIVEGARHGEGLRPGDYINVYLHGRYGIVKEGETRNNIRYPANQPMIENTEEIPPEVLK